MEVETEVRKRVPEFMVVVAFSHQTPLTNADNQTKWALLAWSAVSTLSTKVAEARFDVGKLLQTFATHVNGTADGG